jgi:hypothetical protein
MKEPTKYLGKFRGTVLNNLDPLQIGRIQVVVPDVSNVSPSSWAMPCVPLAGKQEGTFFVPQIGSGVWVEFEHGDPDYPIWVGGFWGSAAEVPAFALGPPAIPPGQNMVLQTTLQNTVLISDAPPTPLTGGIILKSATGAMLVVNDSGVYIQNGKGASIMMVGPMVTINNGGLVVV